MQEKSDNDISRPANIRWIRTCWRRCSTSGRRPLSTRGELTASLPFTWLVPWPFLAWRCAEFRSFFWLFGWLMFHRKNSQHSLLDAQLSKPILCQAPSAVFYVNFLVKLNSRGPLKPIPESLDRTQAVNSISRALVCSIVQKILT